MLNPNTSYYVGADPEGFFSKDGVIVGSERIIPKDGLTDAYSTKPNVVRDGVQFELNPRASAGAPHLRATVASALALLERQIKDLGNQVEIDWRGLVEVGQDELDNLSTDTRMLGCNPSLNVYETWKISVDPLTYRKRSAGGHLHLGLRGLPIMARRSDLVLLLDALVGNTCVLIDRDPGAAERRENYGRAGEHREPNHGLEYRTTSNFWLRHPNVFEMVFGLAHLAVAIAMTYYTNAPLEDEFFDAINLEQFRTAINTNNFDLARQNFNDLRPFLVKHVPKEVFVLGPDNLDRFLVFADGVRAKGLKEFFPEDPLAAWARTTYGTFRDFLNTLY